MAGPLSAPPEVIGDTGVYDLLTPILSLMLAKAQVALEEAGRPASRVLLSPGENAAWDECCQGQLWVRLASILPQVDQRGIGASVPCGVMWWVATIELGILRCAASLDSRGNAPSASAISSDAVGTWQDAQVLQRVFLCDAATRSIISWVPLGTDGGCTGGAWTYTMKLDTCGCAPDEAIDDPGLIVPDFAVPSPQSSSGASKSSSPAKSTSN